MLGTSLVSPNPMHPYSACAQLSRLPRICGSLSLSTIALLTQISPLHFWLVCLSIIGPMQDYNFGPAVVLVFLVHLLPIVSNSSQGHSFILCHTPVYANSLWQQSSDFHTLSCHGKTTMPKELRVCGDGVGWERPQAKMPQSSLSLSKVQLFIFNKCSNSYVFG